MNRRIADAYETAVITQLAVDTTGPFFIRIGKNNEPAAHENPCFISIGEPIPYREQGYILIVFTSTLVSEAINEAEMLEKNDVKVL